MRHGAAVLHACFSADGRLVLTASKDRTARVWEVKAGREPWELPAGREHRVFRGHTAKVHRVAYHPDGRRLATGDDAGVLKLGALAVGAPKMKLQKRCVQRMFETKGTVLELDGVWLER